MTEFGRAVWVLAAKRAITTQQGLTRALGEGFSHDSVRNYLHGRTAVPTRFLHALDAALDLTEDERVDLAMVYAWGETLRKPLTRVA